MARAPLAPLKAEAKALAAALPTLSPTARAASSAHMGSAGRKRAGVGETFWQYRRYAYEDGADRVDWRRSAKDDKLFVRETELETARTYLFWTDPSDGFHWTSDPAYPEKGTRALLAQMTLAEALARAGERCGALGGPRRPALGAKASTRVGEDLWALSPDADFPQPPRDQAAIILASDFYEPLDVWRGRLKPLAARCRDGVMLIVSDPVEELYPFEGRTRFNRPGLDATHLLGRAENIRGDYLKRFGEQRRGLKALAAELGWRAIVHRTDGPVEAVLGALVQAVTAPGRAA